MPLSYGHSSDSIQRSKTSVRPTSIVWDRPHDSMGSSFGTIILFSALIAICLAHQESPDCTRILLRETVTATLRAPAVFITTLPETSSTIRHGAPPPSQSTPIRTESSTLRTIFMTLSEENEATQTLSNGTKTQSISNTGSIEPTGSRSRPTVPTVAEGLASHREVVNMGHIMTCALIVALFIA